MGLFSFNAHSQDEPDFDYPQKVSKDALAQLKKAQKSGDGQMMVDALVRFSIAKGKVSQESMDTVIRQIEDVKKKEKRADYKAILNYLEACVFKDYLDAYGVHDREDAVDEAVQSVKDLDKIVVLNNGEIDAIGTHEKLMKNNEIYKEIYYSQQSGDIK